MASLTNGSRAAVVLAGCAYLLPLLIGRTSDAAYPVGLAGRWIVRTNENAAYPSAARILQGPEGWTIQLSSHCNSPDCEWPETLPLQLASTRTRARGVAVWQQGERATHVTVEFADGRLRLDVFNITPSRSQWSHYDLILRPFEQHLKSLFETAFGETIPAPAVYEEPIVGRCLPERTTTSTAYLKVSDIESDVFVLRLTEDGRILRTSKRRVLTPSGRIRVLTFLIRYEETFSTDAEQLWQTAQVSINRDHELFAKTMGFSTPFVTFVNSTVVLDRMAVDPTRLDDLKRAAASMGIVVADYQIYIAIDMDPRQSRGGRATYPTRSIYVGNYGAWNKPLTAAQWMLVARTAYHHEVVHLWGWDHDWTAVCQSGRPFEPFITDPMLLGWRDSDGDGIVEILDPTPYGRSQK